MTIRFTGQYPKSVSKINSTGDSQADSLLSAQKIHPPVKCMRYVPGFNTSAEAADQWHPSQLDADIGCVQKRILAYYPY